MSKNQKIEPVEAASQQHEFGRVDDAYRCVHCETGEWSTDVEACRGRV